MQLTCPKCSGKMFVDRVYTEESHLEVFCIMCGKRKMYDTTKDNIKWLVRLEKLVAKAANGL